MNALMHPSANVRRVESRIGDFFGKGSTYLSKNDVSVDRDDSSVPRPTLDLSMALAHTCTIRLEKTIAVHCMCRPES